MKFKKLAEQLKMAAASASAMARYSKMTPNEIAAEIKDKSSKDFLYSQAWRKLRAEAHKQYGYRCMCCGYLPKDKRMSHVDHIKPRRFFPELALEFSNVQILCARCNKKKGNKHMTDYRSRSIPPP